jgi:CheY-like chemotaxis protein
VPEAIPTVLVVEDDEALQQLVAMLLEDQHYHVELAGNGEEALQKVKAQMPDLILLDMKMPVMDGWMFVKRLRAWSVASCPIVIMTAAESAKSRALEIGASGWISKPFDVLELRQTVARHIQKRTHAA